MKDLNKYKKSYYKVQERLSELKAKAERDEILSSRKVKYLEE